MEVYSLANISMLQRYVWRANKVTLLRFRRVALSASGCCAPSSSDTSATAKTSREFAGRRCRRSLRHQPDVVRPCSVTDVPAALERPLLLDAVSRASRTTSRSIPLVSRCRANRWNTEAPPIPRTTPEPDGARGGTRPWRNFIPFASRVALPRPTTSAEVSTCTRRENSNRPDRRAPLHAKLRDGARPVSSQAVDHPRLAAHAFLSDAEALGATNLKRRDRNSFARAA